MKRIRAVTILAVAVMAVLFLGWVNVGPNCTLHAYGPYSVGGHQLYGKGATDCTVNQHYLKIQVCVRVKNGSTWYTKNGTCSINSDSGAYAVQGASYQTSDAVSGHVYDIWVWTEDQYGGKTYTKTYNTSAWTNP